MKKGVILDVEEKDSIVLRKDGRFVKVKTKNMYDKGEEIYLGRKIAIMVISFILALIVFVCCILFYQKRNYGPSTFVSIDINPSLSFVVSDDNRITSMGSNDDGREMLLPDEVIGRNLYDVIDDIVEKAYLLGYFELDVSDNALLLSVLKDDINAEAVLQRKIIERLQNKFNELQLCVMICEDICSTDVSDEMLSYVEDLDELYEVTYAKLRMIEYANSLAKELEEEFDIKEATKSSVSRLLSYINDAQIRYMNKFNSELIKGIRETKISARRAIVEEEELKFALKCTDFLKHRQKWETNVSRVAWSNMVEKWSERRMILENSGIVTVFD